MRTTFLAAVGLLAMSAVSSATEETLLERGRYLTQTIAACGNCHTPQTPEGPRQGLQFAGKLVVEMDGIRAYAPNITPDPETGIGKWSDEDLIRAIREGKRPDGSTIGPPMPIEQYRHISDRDVKAIVAYLRTVPPIRQESQQSTYAFPLPESYGPPVETVADVPREDKVAYGAYLAGPVGHCIECHTPMVNGERDYEHNLGAGGFAIPGPWGVSVAANITPHEEGIGGYTDDDIKNAITRGLRPDGSRLAPPMAYAYYRQIKDEDLDALVAYLRTLPPRPSP